MGVCHRNDLKNPSGGRKRYSRAKRKHEAGSLPTNTTLGKNELSVVKKTRGGNAKVKVKYTETVNVVDPKTKKCKKAKILTEKDNPANRNFPRRNIITKGAIIETDAGLARVTSRPGQDGTVNAVLIQK